MALFKILKGNKANLPTTSTEGWIYVTQDTADMHIFTTNSSKIQLNAEKATYLRDSSNNLLDLGSSSKPVYFENGIPVQCGTLSNSTTGNAGTATKFASAQSVALTGDVTGSASSQAGWSVATTLANSGVTAGSYGPSANTSPGNGGTFSVPYITVDAKGRITTASTKTITLPSYSLSTFGITATAAELNKLDGVTATTAELNIVNGLTATTTELNYCDGVTSNIQTQLNGKLGSTATAAAASEIYSSSSTTKAYILGTQSTGSSNKATYFNANVYTEGSVLYGAAWNDYAEYRESKDLIEAGRVVVETGNGDLVLSTKRLEPGANVVSDTFGFAIGQTEKCGTPIAVCGRVLAYPYEDIKEFKAGDPVCAGPNGTISIMSRAEVQEYPDRMIGTVSEIPTYEIWGEGNVPVNGRIWIKVL